MLATYGFFLIPLLLWIIVAKTVFKHEFSVNEILGQIGATAVVLFAVIMLGFGSVTDDVKMVNGVVQKLNPEKQSCPWGWQDYTDGFCTEYRTRSVKTGQICTGSGNTRTCTPTYKTQYKYIYDWERRYFVETSIREYEISRVDRQGVGTPPRFASIKIGDPVTDEVSYTNYIQGASDTLFNQKYTDLPTIPYPGIFDYYKVQRVLPIDYTGTIDFESWNDDIAVVNSSIQKTGANMIVVVTGNDKTWADKLAQAWDAHNINDVVVVIGATPDGTINWVDVRSWSSNDLVNVSIRDAIYDLKTIDPLAIDSVVQSQIVSYYTPRSMEEFEYLQDDISLPTWALIVALLVLLIITPVVTFVLSNPENRF